MTTLHRLLWLTLLWAVALPAAAADRLAVLELTGSAASAEDLTDLSDKLRTGALKAARASGLDLTIMTRESMAVILADMDIDAACVEGQCEVETARNLQAAYVISGRLMKREHQYIVTTKLHRTDSGSLLDTQEVISPSLLTLRSGVQDSGAQLLITGLGLTPTSPVTSTAPAGARVNADFGTISVGMNVASRLREQQCDKEAGTLGESIRAQRIREAEQQAHDGASQAWSSLQSDLEMCTRLARNERGKCIEATNQWLTTARAMQVTLPASIETVATDCGNREVAFEQITRSIVAKNLSAAESMLKQLHESNTINSTSANIVPLPSRETVRCDNLHNLKIIAFGGNLRVEHRKCLDSRIGKASDSDKAKISRVLITDAKVRGDQTDWARLMKRHLETIDRTDANMCLMYAQHLHRLGVSKAQSVIRWADYALENKSMWTGATHTKNVYYLHQLKSDAASLLWRRAEKRFVNDRNKENEATANAYRSMAEQASRAWLEYAKASGKDTSKPLSACVSASDLKSCLL